MTNFNFVCPVPDPLVDFVTQSHGAGGKLSQELIDKVFLPAYGNAILATKSDSGELAVPAKPGRLAMTTDSFVVRPLVFPGGDLGSLAVFGTLNDLAVQGAEPLALTAGWIIEEGFAICELHRLAQSMGDALRRSNVQVIAADTKVVERGHGDGCYLTTSGVGWIRDGIMMRGDRIQPGDRILLSGTIAEHGMAVMTYRNGMEFAPPLQSDCVSLWPLVKKLLEEVPSIRVMRDPTRGGIAASLNEFAEASKCCLRVWEEKVPVRQQVQRACELLGIDPWVVANEGKLLVVVPKEDADQALRIMRSDPLGVDGAIIGEVDATHPRKVIAQTRFGTHRIVPMPTGELLPRIC